MTIEQEARAEAEERYPTLVGYAAIWASGYEAGASRPVTDAEVEKVTRAIRSRVRDSSWDDYAAWFDMARAALNAAEGARR